MDSAAAAWPERPAQHHRGRQDGGRRVGDVQAGDVRRGAVDGLVEARSRRASVRRSPSDADGSMPSEPASTDASSDRMSPNMFSVTMTSKVAGDVMSYIAQESTRRCSSSTSGNSAGDLVCDRAPEPARGQHVGLVDARQALAAAARQLEGEAHDARAPRAPCRAACRRPGGRRGRRGSRGARRSRGRR